MGNSSRINIPDIIDNSVEGQKVSDVLNLLLDSGNSAQFATAYFNLEGFSLVKEPLIRLKSFWLLLGREPGIGDQLTWTGNPVSIMSQDLREDMEDAMSRQEIPPLIKEFLDFIKRDSTHVRICTRHFSHGKAYIVDGIPLLGQVAIQGSSNFTRAGLTSNWELNSVHKQATAVRGIKDWFDRFWNISDDYKQQLIELLSDFTAKYSPYEIYMKALYEYFKDRFDVEVKDDVSNPIFLADFQHDGYIAAKDILETYGGVMLLDSVGLGKTYLGLKLLDDYAYRLRQKALVICPAQLRELVWEPRLKEFAIRVDMFSQEALGRKDFPIDEYKDYDIVLVDESHNFRNHVTHRYENMSFLLSRGKNKKLILLTATPVNNTVFDLYTQVQLIARGKEDFFSTAGIRNLKGYFVQAERDREHLYDLLEEISVRRSRHYIRKNYPNAIIDGKPVKFPDRDLHTERYSLETTYAGLYQEIADTIENLNLATYSLDTYRKKMRLRQLTLWETLKDRLVQAGMDKKEVESFVLKLGRQLAIVHILKTLYLKRLESSIEALRISLDRQKKFQEKFLELLRRGKLLDAASYRRIFIWSGVEDEEVAEETMEKMIQELPEINTLDYDLEAIEQAVDQDVKALDKVLSQMPVMVAHQDDKLEKLKLVLSNLQNPKAVVFSYFKDTARYLYQELQQDKAFIARLGRRLTIVDSGIDSDQRKDRVERFSPFANKKPYIKGTEKEIDILVSTDVLSEGQNLQDCNTVINYDLHWNPVRMIQRAGRVDRLGSDWDLVHIHNFYPEDKLEALLNLVSRLYEKLDAIKRSVGLDVSTLGEAIDPKDFNAIRRIHEEDISIFDELEQASELSVGEFIKQELLDFLKRIGEEKLKRIPLGMGSGIKREGKKGIFVYLRGGDRHFWSYYDLNTGNILERKLDIVKLIHCDEKTPRAEPEIDPYPVIEKVKDHIINRFKQLKVSPLTFKSPQNQILSLLQAIRNQHQVASLIDYYSQPLQSAPLRHLRKIWDGYQKSGNISEFLSNLKQFVEANPIVPSQQPATASEKDIQKEDLKLVCWIALT